MSGGQHSLTILVEVHVARESTLGPAEALSMSDGASTFVVDVWDLRTLVSLAALVPCMLSNAGASLSQAPSTPPPN